MSIKVPGGLIQESQLEKLTRLGFPDLRLFTPVRDDAVRVGRRQRRRTRGDRGDRYRIRDGERGWAVQMQCSCFSLQFPSCMIDRVANAVCRLGEELVVIVERKGSRDTRFDGSRGEGQSVCRVYQKGFGKRSRTCMMVMKLEAVMTDRAVQQLAMPYAICSGVVEVFVHFALQLRISLISPLYS